jgi:hypothetical protein
MLPALGAARSDCPDPGVVRDKATATIENRAFAFCERSKRRAVVKIYDDVAARVRK